MSIAASYGFQQIGYWVCAIGFLFAASLSAFSQLRGAHKWLMVAACATTSAWAVVMALTLVPARGLLSASTVELVRDAVWIAFLVSMQDFRHLVRRRTGMAWPLILMATMTAGVVTLIMNFDRDMGWGIASPESIYPELVLSIVALVLIENLYRNCDVDGRWGIKALCLGLGLVFAFDFILYADALFAGTPVPSFVEARGFIDTLAVPVLLLSVRRSWSWRNEIRISRDVAFHSAVLLGSGIYLLAMAALGIVLHLVGGWPALQMAFVIATVLAMLLIFSSKSFRSSIRVYVSKNFFSHKYDYREVWLKFIRDISLRGQGVDLQNRIVHAVADIFDCPAGALWVLHSDQESFVPTARWNLGEELPSEPVNGAIASYLRSSRWIVDVPEYRRHPKSQPGFHMPVWLHAHPRAWLLAPLIHNSKLQGFLLLGTPRGAVEITWEELDLLKTIGEQAASYLAEEQASRALVEASRLEEFNRWSAFLVHDIKSVVGQMSLLVANAEKHAHDHAFQRDVVATLASAVTRMRKMLEQLSSGGVRNAALKTQVDVAALLQQVGDRWRQMIPSLKISDAEQSMLVEAPEEALVSILDHLIQNALEAAGPEGQIKLALRSHGGDGMLEVQDDGPGMDRTFVNDKLFKALSSNKPNGFGLGTFQVNQLVRGMGGRLEVDSSPGIGTTMRVHLPIMEAGGDTKERVRQAL